jgi:hypothetical protein
MRQQDRLQRRPPEKPLYRWPQLRRLCLEALARESRRFYRERNIGTYLVVDRQAISVVVATSNHGHKYFKAETDPEDPSLLLNFIRVSFSD